MIQLVEIPSRFSLTLPVDKEERVGRVGATKSVGHIDNGNAVIEFELSPIFW